MSLGEKLKELRAEAKQTQKEVSALLNISPRQYSRWETGRQLPSLKKIVDITRLYGISFDSLVDEEKKEQVEHEQYSDLETPVKPKHSSKKTRKQP